MHPLAKDIYRAALLWPLCLAALPAHAAQTISEFDDLGRRKNETIGAEAASATVYKDRLRQTELTEPSGQKSTLTVDALGRPTSEKDPVGTRTWSYLRNGLVKKVAHTAAGTTTQTSLVYGYDHETNATTGLGRLTKYTDALSREVSYLYDAEGRVTRLTYPDTERFVDYSYNARGRLSALRDWAGRLTLFTYDAENRLVLLQRPNGSSREVTYNTAGDLTRILDRGPTGEALLRLDFTWDELGRLSSRTVFPKPGIRPGYSVSSLTYTAASDRLTAATTTVDGQAINTNLTPDADANHTKALKPNGTAVDVTFDARNRVTGLGGALSAGGVAYDYDALDRRIRERRSDRRDEWLVDDAGGLSRRLMRYRQNGSGVEQSRTYYIHGPGLAYEVTEATGAAPQVRYYHADQIGSTLALSDETGAVTDRWTYDPFGAATQTLVGSSTTPFLYAGQSGAVTGDFGVIHLRARDYSTVLRRFLSRDPARDGSNWFAYAEASPLDLIDPSGFGAVSSFPANLLNGLDKVLTGTVDPHLASGGLPQNINNRFSPNSARGIAGHLAGLENHSGSNGLSTYKEASANLLDAKVFGAGITVGGTRQVRSYGGVDQAGGNSYSAGGQITKLLSGEVGISQELTEGTVALGSGMSVKDALEGAAGVAAGSGNIPLGVRLYMMAFSIPDDANPTIEGSIAVDYGVAGNGKHYVRINTSGSLGISEFGVSRGRSWQISDYANLPTSF